MNRQPMIYTAKTIKEWDVDTHLVVKNIKDATIITSETWVPARPFGHNLYPWKWRWECAWGVLTGKYDALQWDDK